MSSFRQLATSLLSDDTIATATLEVRIDGTTDGLVQVWSIVEQAPRAEFDTILDFGGRRLAVCGTSDHMIVVAGAWERHGICGYDATTGKRVWQRTDLKQVQALAPVNDNAVAACFDMRAMQVLDVSSGATVTTMRGVRRYWHSPHGALGAAEVPGYVALVAHDWRVRWRVPVAGFALLAVTFGPDGLLVTDVVDGDSGDPCSVYCLSLAGQLLWRRKTPPETTVPWLGWDDSTHEWLGIEHHVEMRTPDLLVRWSSEGDLLSRDALGAAPEYAFLPGGRLLVTGGGDVLDTKALRPTARLPPPEPRAASVDPGGNE